MPVTKKILNLHDKVEILLVKYPELKDNDRLLINKMWDIELRKMKLNPKTTTIDMFFNLYQEGKLSDADFIKRARRKLQELNIELRGKSWKSRHKEGEITRHTI